MLQPKPLPVHFSKKNPLVENLSYYERKNMFGSNDQRPRHNSYNNHNFDGKKSMLRPFKPKKLERTLTLEEGQLLLDLWRKNNFLDFNNWMQRARAQLTSEFQEGNNDSCIKQIKTYACSVSLTFDQDTYPPMYANGFGKNKKQAKTMAVEKIIIDLIQSGKIQAGLKECYDEILKVEEKKQKEDDGSTACGDDGMTRAATRKKTHNLFKKMQVSLREHKFAEACEKLGKILELKEPEWNEVINYCVILLLNSANNEKQIGHIWSYAIRKKQLSHVKTILDIIADPKADIGENITAQIQEACKEPEESIRNELAKKHNILRARSTNPYEKFDVQNFLAVVEEGFASEASFLLLNKPVGILKAEEMPQKQPFVEQTPFRNYSLSATPDRYHTDIQTDKSKSSMMKMPLSPGEVVDALPKEKLELRNQLLICKDLKRSNIKPISVSLLHEMLDALLLNGDHDFTLSVAETLYGSVKLNDLEFLSTYACNYYFHGLNLLTCELIDSIFSRIDKTRYQSETMPTSLVGTLQRIGYKYTQEVLVFTPKPHENVSEKLTKRILADSQIARDPSQKISEGEYVLMTSLLATNANGKKVVEANPSLCNHINSLEYAVQEHTPAANKGLKNFYSMITESGQTVEFALIGYVKEISKDYMIKLFTLPTEEQTAALAEKDRVWRITKLYNKTYHEFCLNSLRFFCSNTCLSSVLHQLILAPPTVSYKMIKDLGLTQIDEDVREPSVNTNLNPYQQKALKAAICQTITIIQGPPGSGKTTASVEIVMEWLRQSLGTILVCSSSTSSVEFFFNELLRAGVRAVKAGIGEEELWDMHYSLKNKYFGNPKAFPEGFRASDVSFMGMKRILWDAAVVCTNCVGVMSDYLQNMKFNRVLIDDATLSTEFEVLVPLVKNCQQLVLIGDVKQLPPIIHSPLARSKGLSISLVENLMKKGVKSHVFPFQYKMHSSLYGFSSALFYNSMIQNGIDDGLREQICSFKWPNPTVNLAILNVLSKEQACASSFLNIK